MRAQSRIILSVITVLLAIFMVVGSSLAYEFDLTTLSVTELNDLLKDITTAQKRYHTDISSSTQSKVKDLVQKQTESYFSQKNIIEFSWPWFDYTYKRQWDLVSLSTKIEYRTTDGKKHKDTVYGQAFPSDGSLRIVYLLIADEVILDERASLPDPLWSSISEHITNNRTRFDLTIMEYDDLKALYSDVEAEIKSNHQTSSNDENRINNIVKSYVENYYAELGITSVEWPWFDYSYTHEWGKFSETTRIKYYDTEKNEIKLSVYAEVYNNAGTEEVFYLKLGEQIILDERDKLTDEYCIRYQLSERYSEALVFKNNGEYEAAAEMFESLGDFSNSKELAYECHAQITRQTYNNAVTLFNSEQYEAARQICQSLGDYQDAKILADKCTSAINAKKYTQANALLENGNYSEAIIIFSELNDYERSPQLMETCQEAIDSAIYEEAIAAINEEDFELAIEKLSLIPRFKDAETLMSTCRQNINQRDYDNAKELMDSGHYDEAYAIFSLLGDFSDSESLAQRCFTAKESIDRKITFADSNIILFTSQRIKLEPLVEPIKDTAPDQTKVTYKSTNTNIITVSQNGTITAVNEGNARVFCYASDNLDIVTVVQVQVVLPVRSIKLDKSNVKILYNENEPTSALYTFTASFTPANAYDQSITWKSSNEQIATVDSNGVVTALKPGNTIITATANDKTNGIKKAQCTIVVELAVSSIALDIANDTVYVGKTEQIKSTILPEKAKNKTITWTSSDTNVASVNSTGVVKGISSGTAVITATAANGVFAQHTVTVKQGPATFTISIQAQLVRANHVGNNWSKSFYVNDKKFTGSTTITAELDQTIQIKCQIFEDDKNPDYGGFTERVKMTEDIFKNGLTINKTVYVTENGGRYSGYSAEWSVKVTIKKKQN